MLGRVIHPDETETHETDNTMSDSEGQEGPRKQQEMGWRKFDVRIRKGRCYETRNIREGDERHH